MKFEFGNGLEILNMSRFCERFVFSGMGTFVKKIKGMDEVAQKWTGQAPPSATG